MHDKHEREPSSVAYLLGQLTAKVDLLLSNQQSYDKRHDELEERVSVLEKDKAKILGAVLVVSTVIGFVANYFL
ncbi:hypothetical protein [Stutzerimonas stutzeri]|uniref:hypothetical protein n=1 Tax=Stutzerimonas stutzeri TaxID=316 RepID=UPI0002E5A9EA|nr:hypothetical protein [Stutzerimonas stutzeri]